MAHIVTKVAQFPEETLKETKGLRSWLGLLNYARQYIKDLGRLLSPLYSKVSPNGEKRLNSQDWELIRKIKTRFHWSYSSLPDIRPVSFTQIFNFKDYTAFKNLNTEIMLYLFINLASLIAFALVNI